MAAADWTSNPIPTTTLSPARCGLALLNSNTEHGARRAIFRATEPQTRAHVGSRFSAPNMIISARNSAAAAAITKYGFPDRISSAFSSISFFSAFSIRSIRVRRRSGVSCPTFKKTGVASRIDANLSPSLATAVPLGEVARQTRTFLSESMELNSYSTILMLLLGLGSRKKIGQEDSRLSAYSDELFWRPAPKRRFCISWPISEKRTFFVTGLSKSPVTRTVTASR
jgi:hypothetical protein